VATPDQDLAMLGSLQHSARIQVRGLWLSGGAKQVKLRRALWL
jgi:hypothetical protein